MGEAVTGTASNIQNRHWNEMNTINERRVLLKEQ